MLELIVPCIPAVVLLVALAHSIREDRKVMG
jgi:hypothetical protein